MICVDTSALMAIALGERDAEACAEVLASDDELLISAATVVEAYVVATGRQIDDRMAQLIDAIGVTIVPVSVEAPARICRIYSVWGKGRHPARLNITDCYAYDVASQHDCPLLFVGNDFAQTNIRRAI